MSFSAEKYKILHFEAPWKGPKKGYRREGYEANGRCILRPKIEGLGAKAIPDQNEPFMVILGVRFHYKLNWDSHIDMVRFPLELDRPVPRIHANS
jgi:hypothetical protein